MPRVFDETAVRHALGKSWSLRTARQWSCENPAAGQCNVTALVLHELFGGEILRTELLQGFHYYNRIGGRVVDLTDSQFTAPIAYEDRPATRDMAFEGVTPSEYDALCEALLRNLR